MRANHAASVHGAVAHGAGFSESPARRRAGRVSDSFVLVVGAIAACLFFASGSSHAQTTIQTRSASVTFSGEIDLNFIYRGDAFFTATKGEGRSGTGPSGLGTTPYIDSFTDNTARSGATPKPGASEFYLDPNVRLNFDIDVGDNISGVVELRTPFVNLDAGGKNSSPRDGLLVAKDRTLELKQIYADVRDLKIRGLALRAGIQDFKLSLRGRDPFVVDVSGSENPFDGATGVDVDADGIPDVVGGGRPYSSTGFADTLEAAGAVISQSFGMSTDNPTPDVIVQAWGFSIDERYRASGASGPRDRYFWGLSGDFLLGSGDYGKIQAVFFDLMNGTDTHLFTAGGGVQLYPLGSDGRVNWELYAEAYGQGGEYDSNHTASGQDLDQQDAFAVQAGTLLSFPIQASGDDAEASRIRPFVELGYVEVSGDNDYTDTANDNFVSLENNNRTLVVENGYYGLDIDTNYRGFRVSAGAQIEDWKFEILYAYFEWQDNGGHVSGGATDRDKIGDEIDLSILYSYGPALDFGLTVGWLLDPVGLGESEAINVTLFEIGLKF